MSRSRSSQTGEFLLLKAREASPFARHVWRCKALAILAAGVDPSTYTVRHWEQWSGIEGHKWAMLTDGREPPNLRKVCEQLGMLFTVTLPRELGIAPIDGGDTATWLRLAGYNFAETYQSLMDYIERHPEDKRLQIIKEDFAITLSPAWQQSKSPLKLQADAVLDAERPPIAKILAISSLIFEWQPTMRRGAVDHAPDNRLPVG